MTQQLLERRADDLAESGPVEWIVVEFRGDRFRGAIAPALDALVEQGTIRVLDLLLIRKDADDALELFELSDLDETEIGRLRPAETALEELLGADGVTAVADAVAVGRTAALMVWEDRWAVPLRGAVRDAGGRPVAGGRLPMLPGTGVAAWTGRA